jgi:hypothetical protein
MSNVQLVSEIIESNGKTIRQNNMQEQHTIELGTLVEIEAPYLDENGLRVFVVEHNRDCDGTPLYLLSANRNYAQDKQEYEEFKHGYPEGMRLLLQGQLEGNRAGNFSSDSLKVIRKPENM